MSPGRDTTYPPACGNGSRSVRALPEFFTVEYFPQYRDYRYLDYAETEDGYTQTRMKEKARQRFLLARDRRPDAYGAITTITEQLHG